MNHWQKLIPLLSKMIHFVSSLTIDAKVGSGGGGRSVGCFVQRKIPFAEWTVCYATVGAACRFCKRIARNRSLALCVSLALSSPPPFLHHWFHWFFLPLVLVPLVPLVARAKWGPRENDHVPNHPSGIGEI